MKAWSLAWNVAEVSLSDSSIRVLQVRRTGKGCLSYIVGSRGEAAVIDPSLPANVYIDLAAKLAGGFDLLWKRMFMRITSRAHVNSPPKPPHS